MIFIHKCKACPLTGKIELSSKNAFTLRLIRNLLKLKILDLIVSVKIQTTV